LQIFLRHRGCLCHRLLWRGICPEPHEASAPGFDHETLYQVSTIDALMQGVYDGTQPFDEVKRHGDFGIGTFDALDGEMVAVDNRYYQVRSDGIAYPVADTMTKRLPRSRSLNLTFILRLTAR
jgi:hypothetical protein